MDAVNRPLADCLAIDTSGDGQASVDELIRAVSRALQGCGAEDPNALVLH